MLLPEESLDTGLIYTNLKVLLKYLLPTIKYCELFLKEYRNIDDTCFIIIWLDIFFMFKGGVHSFVKVLVRLKVIPDRDIPTGPLFWLVKGL